MIATGDKVETVKDFWQNDLVFETLMLFFQSFRDKSK